MRARPASARQPGSSGNIQRQRMNAPDQIVAQSGMNRAVPFHPAHLLESRRTDQHLEMAFAPLTVPGMTAMAFAIVDDFQPGRLERRLQP